MTFTITPGWWLVPLAITIAAVWWLYKQDYRGDYNFNALFTVPITGFVIASAWAVYSTIGWALS